jgi:hypothetical protein
MKDMNCDVDDLSFIPEATNGYNLAGGSAITMRRFMSSSVVERN